MLPSPDAIIGMPGNNMIGKRDGDWPNGSTCVQFQYVKKGNSQKVGACAGRVDPSKACV